MVIKVTKKKEETEEEGYVELEPSAFREEARVNVRIESIEDFVDADRIQALVREGNVVFLKIRKLRERDMSELKRVVDRLKKTCTAMGGDIAGVDEDYLILTPNFAKVYRGV